MANVPARYFLVTWGVIDDLPDDPRHFLGNRQNGPASFPDSDV